MAFQVLIGIIISGVAFKVWGNGSMTAAAMPVIPRGQRQAVRARFPYDVYYT